MINLKEQQDKILNEQLGKINHLLSEIEEGEQKDYILNALKTLKDKKSLDVLEFVKGFNKFETENNK